LVTVEPARIPKLQAAPVDIPPGHAFGVKVHVKSAANATPNWSRAPAVIVAVYWVPTVRALDGVKVKVVFVASPVIVVAVTPGVTVKVEVLIVAGFIGLLNVAETRVVGQGVEAPTGRTETTVGGVRGEVALPEFLSGSLHPTIATANTNAGIQTFQTLNLRIKFPSSPDDTSSHTASHYGTNLLTRSFYMDGAGMSVPNRTVTGLCQMRQISLRIMRAY
jgi:hypothetical protein